MDLQNFFSFGAKKRVEDRMAQYEIAYSRAKNAHLKLEAARGRAITNLQVFIKEQQKTVNSITSIRSTLYKRLSTEDRLTLKILKSSLRNGRRNLLEISLTEHQIYASTISRISYAESLGITVAGLAAGSATAVGLTMGTSAAIASSTGTSVVAATSITSTGIGHLSWMTVGAVALPLSIVFMAGFNHWNANKKIEKINKAEEELEEKIVVFRENQLKFENVEHVSSERAIALNYNEEYLSKEFFRFYEKCSYAVNQLSQWKKIKAHVSLFFGFKNKDIDEIREWRDKLRIVSLKIYNNLTQAVA